MNHNSPPSLVPSLLQFLDPPKVEKEGLWCIIHFQIVVTLSSRLSIRPFYFFTRDRTGGGASAQSGGSVNVNTLGELLNSAKAGQSSKFYLDLILSLVSQSSEPVKQVKAPSDGAQKAAAVKGENKFIQFFFNGKMRVFFKGEDDEGDDYLVVKSRYQLGDGKM